MLLPNIRDHFGLDTGGILAAQRRGTHRSQRALDGTVVPLDVLQIGGPRRRIGSAGISTSAEDGAQRAQYPAVLRLLQHLEVLPARLSTRLDEWMRYWDANIRNRGRAR